MKSSLSLLLLTLLHTALANKVFPPDDVCSKLPPSKAASYTACHPFANRAVISQQGPLRARHATVVTVTETVTAVRPTPEMVEEYYKYLEQI